jgi:hypothetical protein
VLLDGDSYVFDASCDAKNYVFNNNIYWKYTSFPLIFSQTFKSFSDWKELAGKDQDSRVFDPRLPSAKERVFDYSGISSAKMLNSSFTVRRRNYLKLRNILPLIAQSSVISCFVLQPIAGNDSLDSTFGTRFARERHVALQWTRADLNMNNIKRLCWQAVEDQLNVGPIVVPMPVNITPRITQHVRDISDFFDKRKEETAGRLDCYECPNQSP